MISVHCGQTLSDETFTAQKELYGKQTYKLEEVSGGVWFPVEADQTSFREGKTTLHHHFVLDRDRSSFNDRSAIPAGIFQRSAGEIEHQHQGELRKAYEQAKKAKTPADAEKQGKSATSTLEAELKRLMRQFEEAVARDDERAVARFLDNRRYKGRAGNVIKEMKATVKLGATPAIIRLVSVRGDRALLASDFFEFADSRYQGKQCIVYHMVRDGDKWVIADIDVEDLEGLVDEVRRFDARK